MYPFFEVKGLLLKFVTIPAFIMHLEDFILYIYIEEIVLEEW